MPSLRRALLSFPPGLGDHGSGGAGPGAWPESLLSSPSHSEDGNTREPHPVQQWWRDRWSSFLLCVLGCGLSLAVFWGGIPPLHSDFRDPIPALSHLSSSFPALLLPPPWPALYFLRPHQTISQPPESRASCPLSFKRPSSHTPFSGSVKAHRCWGQKDLGSQPSSALPVL